jgi:hypothetical protein
MRAAALGLIAAAVLASPVLGQQSGGPVAASCNADSVTTVPALRVGDLIRAGRSVRGDRIEGSIVSCTRGVLLVDDGGDAMELVDLAEIPTLSVVRERMRVGVSRSRAITQGTWIGGLSGALVGAVVSHVATSCSGCEDYNMALILLGSGFLAGAVTGAAVAGESPIREWRSVTIRRPGQ